MSNLSLKAINKKAKNYSVERKQINGCASEGYIFTSRKIIISSYEARILAMQLINLHVVQAVEIYSADQLISFNIRKSSIDANGIKVTNENQKYSFSDYFSNMDRGLDLSIIKVTTFNIPSKNIRRISKHRNSFEDVLGYFLSDAIIPLAHLHPGDNPNEEIYIDFQLQLINWDQTEYRVKQLMINDIGSKYFEIDMLLGENDISSLINTIGKSRLEKVIGIYCNDRKSNQAICSVNKELLEHRVIEFWANQDIHGRDSGSIYDISYDYVSLLVELNKTDLEVLVNLKSVQEALQYISK